MSDLERKLRLLGVGAPSTTRDASNREGARDPRRGSRPDGDRPREPDPTTNGPHAADAPSPYAALGARDLTTDHGSVALFEREHAVGSSWGDVALEPEPVGAAVARWAGAPALPDVDPTRVVYIDTETTGLAGGSGTLAFLIGVGRFEAGAFVVRQFALHGPWEEPAQLAAVRDAVSDADAVVSYNGKSFDAPLLATRFGWHGWDDPLAGLPHVDLLHLARRLHGARLVDCTLGEVERGVLGLERDLDDVPGALVPERWRQFVLSGDAEPLRDVRTHNERDIVTLAALLRASSSLLDGRRAPVDRRDALGRARLLAHVGFEAAAERAVAPLLDEGAHAAFADARSARVGRALDRAVGRRRIDALEHRRARLERKLGLR